MKELIYLHIQNRAEGIYLSSTIVINKEGIKVLIMPGICNYALWQLGTSLSCRFFQGNV